jgi:hypothetical protein
MTSCFVRIHAALHPHRVNQASTHQAREERPGPPRPVIMFPLPGWRKRLSLQLVVKRRFLKMGLSFIAKSSFRYSQIRESSHRKKRMYEQDCQITVNGPPPIKQSTNLENGANLSSDAVNVFHPTLGSNCPLINYQKSQKVEKE